MKQKNSRRQQCWFIPTVTRATLVPTPTTIPATPRPGAGSQQKCCGQPPSKALGGFLRPEEAAPSTVTPSLVRWRDITSPLSSVSENWEQLELG